MICSWLKSGLFKLRIAASRRHTFKLTNKQQFDDFSDLVMEELLAMFPASRKDLHLDILDTKLLNPALSKLFNSIIKDVLKLKKTEMKNGSSDLANILIRIESLLDYVWEHLHTGEWKNIDIFWRYLYSYASLFKTFSILINPNLQDEKGNYIQAIIACDMGIIMGAPVLDGLLSKIANKLNEMIVNMFGNPHCSSSETQIPNITFPDVDPSKCVNSFHVPSIEMFLSDIMTKKPAIFTGNLSLI